MLHFIVIDKIEIKEATEQRNHKDRGNTKRGNTKIAKQPNNKKTTNNRCCLTHGTNTQSP